MQSDDDAAGSDAAGSVAQADRVPWARLSACAGVYTAPTALVVAPALADARVLAATGWAPGALTLASGLMFVAARRAPSSARVLRTASGGGRRLLDDNRLRHLPRRRCRGAAAARGSTSPCA